MTTRLQGTDKHQAQITKEASPWNGHYIFLLEGLNMFDGTNLTLTSDVDQDKKKTGSYERSLMPQIHMPSYELIMTVQCLNNPFQAATS